MYRYIKQLFVCYSGYTMDNKIQVDRKLADVTKCFQWDDGVET